jgi:murein DD-endopeptidase MepM/ murein hydrolase activator NlpD
MRLVAPYLSLSLLTACATTPPTPVEPAPAGTFHTVRVGETVWDIARRHGVSVEEIVDVNGLSSPDELAAGQVLFVPAGGRVADDDLDPPPPARSAHGKPPLVWPVDGVVLRDFSPARSMKGARTPFDGLLLAAPAGTPVRAAADGEVLFVGDQGTDYGLLIVIRHGDGLVTVAGHLADPVVKAGDTVVAGQQIAKVGTSGGVESPRLHFQVRRGRTTVDPLPLLPR